MVLSFLHSGIQDSRISTFTFLTSQMFDFWIRVRNIFLIVQFVPGRRQRQVESGLFKVTLRYRMIGRTTLLCKAAHEIKHQMMFISDNDEAAFFRWVNFCTLMNLCFITSTEKYRMLWKQREKRTRQPNWSLPWIYTQGTDSTTRGNSLHTYSWAVQ